MRVKKHSCQSVNHESLFARYLRGLKEVKRLLQFLAVMLPIKILLVLFRYANQTGKKIIENRATRQ